MLPATFGTLTWMRAVERPDLLAPSTSAAIEAWARLDPRVADVLAVAEIDPDLADTAAMTEAYDLPLAASANCVLVSGRREGAERIAAAVVRATTRADVNNVVKRLLDVRKASFLPMDRATAESGMEYGGITPLGLPAGYRVLVDGLALE
jgi:prolyl-tRNA editing enzyme YbaK/EbsC (Cys-tRNA(Pro) deacylase)